jgi:hypothetical protein
MACRVLHQRYMLVCMRHLRKSVEQDAAVTTKSISFATHKPKSITGSRKRCFGKRVHKELPYARFREAHVTERELPSHGCYDAGTRITSGVLGGLLVLVNVHNGSSLAAGESRGFFVCKMCVQIFQGNWW